jgi:hypothetical protein
VHRRRRARAAAVSEIRFVEHPNLVNPRGQDRGCDDALVALAYRAGCSRAPRSRSTITWSWGIRVVTRATWTGTLAIDARPRAAGTALRAACPIHFTLRDGRIVLQENFDCYDAPAGAA